MKRNKVLIIAEAGVNHNGDFEKAKQLVLEAAHAGADVIKFQTFQAEKLVTKQAAKADYQQQNDQTSESQYEMLKKLELPFEWHFKLNDIAKQHGILFFSTGFDVESNNFLEQFDFPFYKIPSGELTNKPYLQNIAMKGKEVLLSTGMASIEEVQDALKVLTDAGLTKSQICILHCNTEYPTPMEDVNLKAMGHIEKVCEVAIGYSDHTLGIEVPIAAVALGATVIEKHFTLDKTLPGPDHPASLEPHELKAMVQGIRNIEKAIAGNGLKQPSPSEIKNKPIARKSLFAAKDLSAGTILSPQDIAVLRPGSGISPMQIDAFIGKKIQVAIKQNTMLTWEMIES